MNWFVIASIVIIIYYIISKRNTFNELRRAVKQQGAQIGIQIEKRSACLNDAMSILKVGHQHEIDGIARLTAGDQLSQLAFLGQKYPDLASISGYQEAMQNAISLNKDIAGTREMLNGNIRAYNDAITAFPALLVAKVLGYKEEKFVDEENIEKNKILEKRDVDFSNF